jgi:hypothetical protein
MPFIATRRTEADRLRAALEANMDRQAAIRRAGDSKAHEALVRAKDATTEELRREFGRG